MKQEFIFGLVVLIVTLPIVGIVDYLIDKFGLEEDKTLDY